MPETTPRLVSLDVFRGLIIVAMVIVIAPGDVTNVYPPLRHAPWNGWTLADLIFPWFVFVIGASVTLSTRTSGPILAIVRRAAILLGIGWFLSLYPRFEFTTMRLTGVLPRLAVCYLIAALVYRAVRDTSERTRIEASLGAAAVLLVGYWALLSFVAAPGGVRGDLSESGNLGAWIDRTVIGSRHLWPVSKTWDPEGLLSTLPAIATALTGVAAGVFIASARSAVDKTATLVVIGGGLMAAAIGWDQRFPINGNLWTSSFVLFTSGLAAIGLASCYWFIDGRDRRAIIRPLVVLGRNALAMFVLSEMLVKTLMAIHVRAAAGATVTLYDWLFLHSFARVAEPQTASLLFAVAVLVVLYIPFEILYRRGRFFVA